MQNISVSISAYPSHKDITVISAKGFIDTTTAPEFEKAFQSALADKKFNLVINLKEVNYISSVGWGIFIGEIKRIRSQKGDLFLASMGPEVEEAYNLLEFYTIIKAFADTDQAVLKGFGKLRAKKGAEKSKAVSSFEPRWWKSPGRSPWRFKVSPIPPRAKASRNSGGLTEFCRGIGYKLKSGRSNFLIPKEEIHGFFYIPIREELHLSRRIQTVQKIHGEKSTGSRPQGPIH